MNEKKSSKYYHILIGAGVHCDGQFIILQDLLGLSSDSSPLLDKAYDTE